MWLEVIICPYHYLFIEMILSLGCAMQKYGITFLNGVGVWHRGFEYTIDANSYYDTRNTLIELAINKEKGKKESLCRWF